MSALRIPHDFDRLVTPQDIEEYYNSCCPSSNMHNHFHLTAGIKYLNSISTYYHEQAASNKDCPRCTLANVLATAKHCDVVLVLHLLKAHATSAALVPTYLFTAIETNAYQHLHSLMATFRSPLNQLHIPIEARQRVQRFLPVSVLARA
jgi:hypothetical protein